MSELQEYTFNFELLPEDSKKHIPLSFEVEEGAKEIIIEGSFEPKLLDEEESKKSAIEALKMYINQGDFPLDIDTLPVNALNEALKPFIPIRNLINFRLFDPLGNFRGTGDDRFYKGLPIKIGEHISSLGCVSGKIYPGKWRFIIETHMVVKKCILNVKIKIDNEDTQEIPELSYGYKPIVTGNTDKKGWVAGDFHAHSNHSDGSLPIEGVAKNAIERGLDFIFLTDHNKISGWSSIKREGFPVFPGVELTTFWGHFTAFGVNKYIEWSVIDPSVGISKASELVHSLGGLFCVAHPFTIGDPICTGCRCTLDVDWSYVDALEIWAGFFKERRNENTESLKLWRRLLLEGYRITGIGSTDIHTLQDVSPDSPKTYVFVEKLDLANILDSLKRGRVFITRGPRIDFSIDDATIGDTIKVNGRSKLSYSSQDSLDLKVFYNGETILEIPNTLSGEVYISLGMPGYIYLEFWERNSLVAITNPIFIS